MPVQPISPEAPTKAPLRERVFEALSNAVENGYSDILEEPICNIAADLADYEPTMGEEELDEVIECIEKWLLLKQGERI